MTGNEGHGILCSCRLVPMTSTIMQGHSGSATANNLRWIMSTTKQAMSFKLASTVGHFSCDLDFENIHMTRPPCFFFYFLVLLLQIRGLIYFESAAIRFTSARGHLDCINGTYWRDVLLLCWQIEAAANLWCFIMNIADDQLHTVMKSCHESVSC